jgi:Ni,Fe-hydrogenase III small subunit
MIFAVAARSLTSKSVLIPIESLLGDCSGSRMPAVDPGHLSFDSARQAIESCPTSALRMVAEGERRQFIMDYGECIGCGYCLGVGDGLMRPAGKVLHCGVARAALIRRWDVATGEELLADDLVKEGAAEEIRRLFGRALNIRQVDAGSCNGCEAEIGALTSPYYDLERCGIHFVASPKHADMLLVTGPVTHNMAEALRNTYEATPSPRLVVAVGACGCSGGIFSGSYAVRGGIDAVIPVDAYIPGCPPTPAMLLTGILRVLGAEMRER